MIFITTFLIKMSVVPEISNRILPDIEITYSTVTGTEIYYSDGLAAQYTCILILTRVDGLRWTYYVGDKIFIRRSGDDRYDDIITSWLFE